MLKLVLLGLNLKPDFPAASPKHSVDLSLARVSHLSVHDEPSFTDRQCHRGFRDLVNHLKHGPLTQTYADLHRSVPDPSDVEFYAKLVVPLRADVPRPLPHQLSEAHDL
jgi:hypothetical protein